MFKKTGIILSLVLAAPIGLSGTAFAQQTEQTECPPECVTDTLEIVTWYPSPYSEYEELRLYPVAQSNSQCDQNSEGLMYYNNDKNQVLLCKETGTFTYDWAPVGGGTSGNYSTFSRPICDAYTVGTIIFDTDKNKPYVCVQGGLYKPLDSDYDEDGITDAVDANDNDFNDATAVEANVETGKTFYARGGSRRTGALVASNIGGICMCATYSPGNWITCADGSQTTVLGFGLALEGNAYYGNLCIMNRYNGCPCACPIGYTLTQIGAPISPSQYDNSTKYVYYCKKS